MGNLVLEKILKFIADGGLWGTANGFDSKKTGRNFQLSDLKRATDKGKKISKDIADISSNFNSKSKKI